MANVKSYVGTAAVMAVFLGSALWASGLLLKRGPGFRHVPDEGTPSWPMPANLAAEAGGALARMADEFADVADLTEATRTIVQSGRVEDAQSQGLRIRDIEWSRLPVARYSLSKVIVGRPFSLDADQVFRHPDVNPNDVFIDSAARSAIKLIVLKYVAVAERLNRERASLAKSELRHLIEIGESKSQPLVPRQISPNSTVPAEMSAIRSAREAGIDVTTLRTVSLDGALARKPIVVQASRDRVYSATRRQLPATSKLIEAEEFISLEIAALIQQLFDMVDPNTAAVREKFLADCYEIVNNRQNPRK